MRYWRLYLGAGLLIFSISNYILFHGRLGTPSAQPLVLIEVSEDTEESQQEEVQEHTGTSELTAGRKSDAVQEKCSDKLRDCAAWAQRGDCISNAAFVLPSCQDSCGVCRYYTTPNKNVRKKVQLSNGRLMPRVGFGTAGLGEHTQQAVTWALEAGYRLLDSAQAREWYREDLVGAAISDSGIAREDLFLTSKLHPRDLGRAGDSLARSLIDLRTSYLDLFLLHYPRCWPGLCGSVSNSTWREAWRELEDAVDAGQLLAIGVSNFDLADLSELMHMARIKPAVVQRNSDLFSADAHTQTFCRMTGIQYQGYSSLGSQWLMRGHSVNPVLHDPVTASTAASHNVTAAQVVLRWALQHNQVVIPKSSEKGRIISNLDVFDSFSLSRKEMRELDALDGMLQ